MNMSLTDLRKRFSTQHKCEKYLKKMRWTHGVICPFCGCIHNTYLKDWKRWQCRSCKRQFTVTSHTIFHGTRLPLIKWFEAIWLMCNSPKGVSAKQIQRHIGVTYKVAWRMTHQIRKAMKHDTFHDGLCGIVEVDETEIKTTGGGGGSDRNTVLGMYDRDGFLKMAMIENYKSLTIERVIAKNFKQVSAIYSDGAHWLRFLKKYGKHEFVRHYTEYCKDEVHTNNIENVWSPLKRGIVGIFHHISTKYLQSYLDEFSFRFSNREDKGSMFDAVLSSC